MKILKTIGDIWGVVFLLLFGFWFILAYIIFG